jgi:hypothetical protein
MKTLAAFEYTMFSPAKLLLNWREKRPSNQDDLDSSATGQVRRVCNGDKLSSDFIVVP